MPLRSSECKLRLVQGHAQRPKAALNSLLVSVAILWLVER